MSGWAARASLRIKVVLTSSALTLIAFTVLTLSVLQQQWESQSARLRDHSLAFARLSSGTIVDAYRKYSSGGKFRLRILLLDVLSMDPDLEQVVLLDVNGTVLFDSQEIRPPDAPILPVPGQERVFLDPSELEKIRGIEPVITEQSPLKGGSSLEILVPYLEDWGRHEYSIRYRFSYRAIREGLLRIVLQMGLTALVVLLMGLLFGWFVARRITRPLCLLQEGLHRVVDGDIAVTVPVHGSDEVAVLAGQFNEMTGRLGRMLGERDQAVGELRALYRDLDGQVRERTEALDRNNRLLESTLEELRAADRAKTVFLAHMSHELRTPLNSIIGFSGLLLQDTYRPLMEQERKDLGTIYANACRLLGLINDILDYSKTESGLFDLSIGPVDLATLVQDVLATAGGLIGEKAIRLSQELDEDLPRIKADPVRLHQAVLNLVSNAIQYSSQGTVRVLGRLWEEEPGWVLLSVEDEGPGIHSEHLERIFREFIRLEVDASGTPAGAGLGLALVRRYVEKMGGRVWAESKWGEGSCFQVLLPVYREEAEPVPGQP